MAEQPVLALVISTLVLTILLFASDVTTSSELRTCPWKRLAGDVIPESSVMDTSLVAATKQECVAACLQQAVCEGFCYNVTTSRCYVINMAASNTTSPVSLSGQMQCYALAGQCPYSQGYSLSGCRCVKFYPTGLNYTSARTKCAADGAHLYHLKSLAVDRKPYYDLLKANGKATTAMCWVGADDLLDGQDRLSDGTPLPAGAKEWRAGEPNNVYEHCVCMSNGLLYDVLCDTKTVPFACQIDINP